MTPPSKPKPLYLVFEGPDGSGKTSLSARIGRELRERGVNAIVAAFPGRRAGSLGELVYRIHHDPLSAGIEGLTPSAMQALHIGAQLDAIETTLLPHLETGVSLLLDRYWWSTWVYGCFNGVSRPLLDSLVATQAIAWRGVQPDLIFLLHRTKSIHPEVTIEDYRGISALYAQLAERESPKQPVCHIDNECDFETTARKVLDVIGSLRKS